MQTQNTAAIDGVVPTSIAGVATTHPHQLPPSKSVPGQTQPPRQCALVKPGQHGCVAAAMTSTRPATKPVRMLNSPPPRAGQAQGSRASRLARAPENELRARAA